MIRMRHAVLAATAVMLSAAVAHAGHYCKHCGCQRNCKKVCRLECGKKKETKTEYSAECEDFCVPGPSKKCGVKVECDGHGHHHRTILWQPTCAKVHTRKKLVKKEVTKEVPDYKWVVEEYCCVCGRCVKVDGKDKDDNGGGYKKAERLPLPLAATDAPATPAADGPSGDYDAYYRGAEIAVGEEVNLPVSLSEDDDAPASTPDEASPAEPRRLFFGLLGR